MRLQPSRWTALALALVTAATLASCSRRPSMTTDGEPAVNDGSSVNPAGPFRFPRDRGGALLAELLPPDARPRPTADEAVRRPRDFGDPLTVVAPDLGLTPLNPDPPNLAPEFPAVAGPLEPLPEDVTLARELIEPDLPPGRDPPATAGVRLPAPDLSRPVPLPVLAVRRPDVGPLDSPTGPAAAAAAVGASAPDRTAPAPFVRTALPDPPHTLPVEQLPVLPVRPPGR